VELADGTRLGAGRVVVCAGALHSPALLRASGVAAVGDRRPVVDHPSVVLTVVLGPEARCPLDRPVAPISGVLRWSSDQGMGPAGDTSAPFPPVADLMTFVMDHVGAGSEGRRYGALVVVLADVASVGSLWWEGSRARFDPGWLAHPVDRQRLVAGVRQVAELVASTPMADVVEEAYADEYGTPLAEVVGLDDAELARWLEAHPGPVVHPAATCAPVSLRPTAEPPDGAGLAGAAIDAVVDLDGSVRGHTRLHVIDGSTLPYVPAANPQLPIMAVATGLASNLVDGATP
jgi:choline dehydrogenase-like flavoprotein